MIEMVVALVPALWGDSDNKEFLETLCQNVDTPNRDFSLPRAFQTCIFATKPKNCFHNYCSLIHRMHTHVF